MTIFGRITRFKFFGLDSAGLGLFTRMWSQLLGLGVFIFAGMYLTISDFGQFALTASIVILLNTLMYVGPFQYIVKSSSETIIDTAFWINMSGAIFLSLLLLSMSQFLSVFLHAPLLIPIVTILSPSIILSAICAWIEAIIVRRSRFVLYFWTSFVAETIGAAWTILFLRSGYGPESLAIARLAVLNVELLLFFFFVRVFPKHHFDKKIAIDILNYSAGLYGSAVLSYVSRYSGDFLLSYYVAPVATGYFRFANRVNESLSQVVQTPIEKIALSRIGTANRSNASISEVWFGIFSATSIVLWPALAALGISSPYLLIAVLGERWLPAAPIISLLALARATSVYGALLVIALSVKGMTRISFFISLTNSAITVIILFVTCQFGVLEAAIGQAATGFFTALIFVGCTNRVLQLPLYEFATATLIGLTAVAFVAFPTAIASSLTHASALSAWPSVALVGLTAVISWSIVCIVVFRNTIRLYLA